VVRQQKGERNFHAFYYVLAGCDKTERAVWGIHEAKNYRYTNQSKVYDIVNVDPRKEFVNLKVTPPLKMFKTTTDLLVVCCSSAQRALTVAGIKVHYQHLTFTLLAAILHLGNIKLEQEDGIVKVKNPEGEQMRCSARVTWSDG